MNGFQIPATKEGEIRKKKKIGRVNLERSISNIFAVRVVGNLVETFHGGNKDEANLTFPNLLELFLAGTLTQDISYFFEYEAEQPEIEGGIPDPLGSQLGEGEFEEVGGEFVLARSFLIFNLGSMIRGAPLPRSGLIAIGPMLRIGMIDPSTFFSFPMERQYFKGIPGRVDSGGRLRRFSLPQSGFASSLKFFGVRTSEGGFIEVTENVFYNGEGFGIDLHAMVGNFILQAGMLQGVGGESRDINMKKDPYLMGRFNFGGSEYLSGSVSVLANWGNDTAMVNKDLVDWFRYGFAGNIKYKHLDLYGAIIWDKIRNLPMATLTSFDEDAYGITVEADYLATDKLLLMVRYDQLSSGGFINQKEDGMVVSFQARYYIRDNLGIFLRDSYNINGVSANPLNSFRNALTLGVDFDW
ncbi:MAG: hypothetical protein ABGX83_09135 [Nitrospira sp.]|nr:hypothetical protein [Candidatus Manganitrophaceae bacterium]HIL33869.1 hypothetical protein [Candidatus Manganitrophaceae bacterium]